MLLGLLLTAGFLTLPLLAAEDVPPPAEQQQIIAAIREAAMAFDHNLPNFICTQLTHREMRREMDLALGVHVGGRGGSYAPPPMSGGLWQPVDSFEQTLSYFDHHETYQLVKRNGKLVKKKTEPSPPGLTSSGEFGSTLIHIFEKESKADFEWKREDTLRGHPVYVFAFHIEKQNSAAEMSAGAQKIIVAYHGLIYADKETETVLRVTTEAEVPPDFPLQGAVHVLDYGNFSIAGEKYLLPLHAEVQTRASEEFMRSGRVGDNAKQATLRNTVDFSGYRKYATESIMKPE